ncbi:MAG: hypothetical protein ACTSRI_15020 [Promethearchaeota archaeon]
MSKEENSNNSKLGMKAVIISTSTGIPLASVKIDEKLDEKIIAPFFSALHSFSDENLDVVKESLIKTGNLDMLLQKKHGLILIAIMDKSMKKVEIGIEAEQALDLVYEMYKEEIDKINKNINIDLTPFRRFEVLLEKQIRKYYDTIDRKESFFSKFIKSFKSKPGEIR